MEISESTRGNKVIIFDRHEYLYRRKISQGEIKVWRCRVKACSGYLHSKGDDDQIIEYTSHSHEPLTPAQLEARSRICKAKKLMQDLGVCTSDAIASVLTGATEEVLAEVVDIDHLKRTLARKRGVAAEPLTVANFKERCEGTVLFDSGLENERRLIITGEKDMIPVLEKAIILYCDATLPPKVRPTYNLYRIHAQIGEPPCVYALLSHKDQKMIEHMFRALKEIAPELRPAKIMTDFQKSTLTAAKIVFPLADVKICFLRFSEAVIRKINSIGLKSVYDESEESREFLKCITSLAFVRTQDVKIVFNLLISDYPDTKSHLKFIKYFRETFIGTDDTLPIIPIDCWNHYIGALKMEPTTSKSGRGFILTEKLTELAHEYHRIDKRYYLRMLTHI